MKQLHYNELQETLYHEILDNGLHVYILPKPGYHKTYCTFTTKYGSIDNKFVPFNEKEFVRVPDGIAHFLEHKMFEKEDGDVFQTFSKQGASANAFTSFTRTAYLFSSTSQVEENLELLLDFVQEPYFTEASVEKEKGIIGQEIQMYQDNADWRLYFGVIQSLFETHPVKIDIAGTIESIDKITKDLLYQCHATFYHPSNMLLFIVGDVDPYRYMELVKHNQSQKTFESRPPVQHADFTEKEEVYKKKSVIEMSVSVPKCLVGIKRKDAYREGTELLVSELCVQIILDYVFGYSSQNYKHLLDEGIIDDSFSYDYSEEYGYGFAMIGGDTDNPDLLHEKIVTMLYNFVENGMDEVTFNRIKKKKIGNYLRALNSPEFIANQFTRYAFNEMDLFSVADVLNEIKIPHVMETAKDLIDEKCITVCEIVPKK